jgi:two-component system sensor kinase FixL
VKYHRPNVYPRVRVYAEQAADAVKIFVQDNGIGFEQENAERIFQPFQRLVGRSQYEGSGMGLAICQKIVERHAGEIKAESKPGQGTTFIVTLPQYPSPNIEEDNHEYKATDPDR